MLALILTDVSSLGGADLRDAPPMVERMTVAVAAVLAGLAPKTVQNELSEFKDRFDPPMYRRGKRGRWMRLITARDLQTLRKMHPIVSRPT